MKKIYGNKFLISTLGNMVKNNHPVNSVIFHGEKGCGKKLFADYYTSLLLCESPKDGIPCGNCTSCSNIEKGIHPDVTYAETSGKLGGYSVDTARKIRSDAFIKPNNNTGKKVYIFRDCRNMSVLTQNMLLKIVEEPPEYAYFIFTAESLYEFLPTIISRCMAFGVSPCTEDETRLSLREDNFSEMEINSAISCFHGNIGMCKDYIKNDDLKKQVDLTKKLSDSIIRKDEYAFNAAIFSIGSERSNIRELFSLFDVLLRDSAVLTEDKNAQTIGCYREGALNLVGKITALQVEKIHNVIEKTWGTINSNVSVPLALSAMSAEIFSIIY